MKVNKLIFIIFLLLCACGAPVTTSDDSSFSDREKSSIGGEYEKVEQYFNGEGRFEITEHYVEKGGDYFNYTLYVIVDKERNRECYLFADSLECFEIGDK